MNRVLRKINAMTKHLAVIHCLRTVRNVMLPRIVAYRKMFVSLSPHLVLIYHIHVCRNFLTRYQFTDTRGQKFFTLHTSDTMMLLQILASL
jgi:hypothetical protein